MSRRTRGVAAPPATGTSVRPVSSTMRRVFGRVKARGTLPATAVTASILSSGERRASRMAMASSTPVSQSRMMRRGAAAASENVGRVLASRVAALAPRNDLRDISEKKEDIVLLQEAYKVTGRCDVWSGILQQRAAETGKIRRANRGIHREGAI